MVAVSLKKKKKKKKKKKNIIFFFFKQKTAYEMCDSDWSSDVCSSDLRLLDSGGYVYQYTAIPVPEAKRRLHDALDEWVADVHDAIDAFDPDER